MRDCLEQLPQLDVGKLSQHLLAFSIQKSINVGAAFLTKKIASSALFEACFGRNCNYSFCVYVLYDQQAQMLQSAAVSRRPVHIAYHDSPDHFGLHQ